jgi:hypothetical protein
VPGAAAAPLPAAAAELSSVPALPEEKAIRLALSRLADEVKYVLAG